MISFVTTYLLEYSSHDRFGDQIFVGRQQAWNVWWPNVYLKTKAMIGLVANYFLRLFFRRNEPFLVGCLIICLKTTIIICLVIKYLFLDSKHDKFGDLLIAGKPEPCWVLWPTICWKTKTMIGLATKYLLEESKHGRFGYLFLVGRQEQWWVRWANMCW